LTGCSITINVNFGDSSKNADKNKNRGDSGDEEDEIER
jgi:hypothetical protein